MTHSDGFFFFFSFLSDIVLLLHSETIIFYPPTFAVSQTGFQIISVFKWECVLCIMYTIQSIEMTMSETRPLWSELLMMINLFAENCRDDFGVNVLWWHIKIYATCVFAYKFASNWMKLRDNRGIIGSIGQHFGEIVHPHTIYRIIIFCN